MVTMKVMVWYTVTPLAECFLSFSFIGDSPHAISGWKSGKVIDSTKTWPCKSGKKGFFFLGQLMLPIKPIGNLNSLDFSEATFFLKLIALSVNLEKFPYYFSFF